MRYKLVALDLDGTLIEEKSSWEFLHRHFGTQAKASGNLEAYERGEIDYREFMRRDISLWKNPHISEIERAFSPVGLKPFVAEAVNESREKGLLVAIITGGIDLLARRVAAELGIVHVNANGLEVNGKGYLTGEGILRVEPRFKHLVLRGLAADLNLSPKERVAVGDSKYDVSFLRHAGLGIAIGDDPELSRVADIRIPNFEHFPRFLDLDEQPPFGKGRIRVFWRAYCKHRSGGRPWSAFNALCELSLRPSYLPQPTDCISLWPHQIRP